MGLTISEARELLVSPIWPLYRDHVARTGDVALYPAGDFRRIEYLDEKTRAEIALWQKAVPQIPVWQKVVSGDRVRALRAEYPGVYPEILRYAAYFHKDGDPLPVILKFKFPEVYKLCCS